MARCVIDRLVRPYRIKEDTPDLSGYKNFKADEFVLLLRGVVFVCDNHQERQDQLS